MPVEHEVLSRSAGPGGRWIADLVSFVAASPRLRCLLMVKPSHKWPAPLAAEVEWGDRGEGTRKRQKNTTKTLILQIKRSILSLLPPSLPVN